MYKKSICHVCLRKYQPTSGFQRRCQNCIDAASRARGRRKKDDPVRIKTEFGNHCSICNRELNIGKPGPAGWVRHHLRYEPECIVLICKACHLWLHGLGAVWQHDFKKKYKKDLAPYVFAKRVVQLYEDLRPGIEKYARWTSKELIERLRGFDYLTEEEILTVAREAELRRQSSEEEDMEYGKGSEESL